MKPETLRSYRKKPGWIFALAAAYLILPFLTLYQYYLQLDRSVGLLKEIVYSDFFIFEVFCSVTASLAILTVSRAGFFYFLALSLYITTTKVSNLLQHNPFASPLDITVTSFWFLACALMLLSPLRTPYLNPKSRWWTQPTRFHHLAHGVLIYNNCRFPIVTLNVSTGGLFVKLDERAVGVFKGSFSEENKDWVEKRTHPPAGPLLLSEEEIDRAAQNRKGFPSKIGENVRVQVPLLVAAQRPVGAALFESSAQVVWVSQSKGTYQYGLGLKFTGLDRQEKGKLKQYIKLLQRDHYREIRA